MSKTNKQSRERFKPFQISCPWRKAVGSPRENIEAIVEGIKLSRFHQDFMCDKNKVMCNFDNCGNWRQA